MKHVILGILALSAGLQNANAMEDFNHQNTDITNVVKILPPFREDIERIKVLKNQNKIEIELKTSEESIMQEVISIDIPNKHDITIKRLDMDYENSHQALLEVAVILKSMLINERIDILTSYQPLIVNMNNVGAGLRDIELYNAGLIGQLSFAYNLPLSNVTIYTHNAGLVIDYLAFKNCGTIDSFSINGDIEYISDNAFDDTIINNMILDRQPNLDVYQSLINNRNIKNINWKTEMSEEEDY